jgi:predicted glycoside hydrolase/deacetylase ChbG (UPF0249 family)
VTKGGKKHLIVNADDYGWHEAIDKGILEAADRGIVTSVTCFATMGRLEAVGEALNRRPNLGAGVHLDLTHGWPVASPEKVPSLIGDDGRFRWTRETLDLNARAEEVHRELHAQIEAFVATTGRQPTHVDGHKHLYQFSKLAWRAVVDLAQTYRLSLRAETETMRRVLREMGLSTPDAFLGDVGPEAYWSVERLRLAVAGCPQGVTELMTHPGHDPPAGLTTYSVQRAEELSALCDPAVKEAAREAGVTLIHFGHFPLQRK